MNELLDEPDVDVIEAAIALEPEPEAEALDQRVAPAADGAARLQQRVAIKPPNMVTAEIRIRGTAPYVQNRMAEKALNFMRERQEMGHQAKKGSKREAKDFEEAYKGAMHVAVEGWHGIPAPAFRCAMIDACRLAGYAMTRAKCSIFTVADGYDQLDGTPLVKINKGQPKMSVLPVRNTGGSCDLRPRPMWDPGWEAAVRVRYDADEFDLSSVTNLLMRAGEQVGVGEGRPYSKKSCGMGWGTFELVSE